MRFHILGLPHTQITEEFLRCAYTQKIRKLVPMLVGSGHEVFLYGSVEHDTNATEFISCIPRRYNPDDYTTVSFGPEQKDFKEFNEKAISELAKRLQPRDFILTFAGLAQKPIADAFPAHMFVEAGIGYLGSFSKYRVFESYAWMQYTYGHYSQEASFYDAVIPNYFEPNDFPLGNGGKHYLFVGRMNWDKGPQIAVEATQDIGKLILAGQGGEQKVGRITINGSDLVGDHLEYVGVVDTKKRATLMGDAIALFAPSLYNEPFGGVAVEAMMCGTPVITTDWGAYTETVLQGDTGFRCRSLTEFRKAALDSRSLSRREIRAYAVAHYSTDVIAARYEDYFNHLLTLWGNGWYEM